MKIDLNEHELRQLASWTSRYLIQTERQIEKRKSAGESASLLPRKRGMLVRLLKKLERGIEEAGDDDVEQGTITGKL